MEINDCPGTYNSIYFLIFPLADGNLRQFWQRHLPQAGDSDGKTTAYAPWVAKQLYGLTWALCKLHYLNRKEAHWPKATEADDENKRTTGGPWYGIHGDIKPENLLWYAEWVGPRDNKECPGIIPPHESAPLGVLQLADFGISTLHQTATRSDVELSRATKTYAPPEIEWGKGQCSRSFDIWSLGCVFLEFLCWLVQGGCGETNPVDDFHQARRMNGENQSLIGLERDTFYHSIANEKGEGITYEVNPEVIKARSSTSRWMERIWATNSFSARRHVESVAQLISIRQRYAGHHYIRHASSCSAQRPKTRDHQ